MAQMMIMTPPSPLLPIFLARQKERMLHHSRHDRHKVPTDSRQEWLYPLFLTNESVRWRHSSRSRLLVGRRRSKMGGRGGGETCIPHQLFRGVRTRVHTAQTFRSAGAGTWKWSWIPGRIHPVAVRRH